MFYLFALFLFLTLGSVFSFSTIDLLYLALNTNKTNRNSDNYIRDKHHPTATIHNDHTSNPLRDLSLLPRVPNLHNRRLLHPDRLLYNHCHLRAEANLPRRLRGMLLRKRTQLLFRVLCCQPLSEYRSQLAVLSGRYGGLSRGCGLLLRE
ncbi:hypothetical protein ASPACDRAFT_122188 [Aspergillus aculeatus ATCC 16872]|uniref:Secreted protein n=1 Tax=Aspergillus aculeatus (strain ATCC 16872 / CBS 172.66 / WB 5094) TaxID=690307 RepID=A0A1L9WQQ4_ASPA1|nr:uncharacterized protein ASPACDRAFT_122188 [Aspergillus aculeatus ATCC 16872]OJJ98377.1 hypothetical protein ASPACDRAFT_122188 [Aspergillus aculeatus ATCC 16872]